MQAKIAWTVLTLAFGVGACGGAVDGGAGSDGGAGGEGGIASPACPATAPSDGTACPVPNAQCEYGSDFVASCNALWLCTSGVWRAAKQTPCANVVSPQCPASYAAVPRQGKCPTDQLSCTYPQGRCTCTHNVGPYSQDPLWVCSDAAAGCPSVRPRLGTACTQPGQTCDYGSCSVEGGSAVRCDAGIWKLSAAIPCPL